MQRYTTSYSSKPVEVDPKYIVTPPADAIPIEIERIDFNMTTLRERGNAYAAVLDNVLSASECAQLIRYAEASSSTTPAWQVALVNPGGGMETYVPDYRNSQRILWDDQHMAELIWARCAGAPGLADDIAALEGAHVSGTQTGLKAQRWRFSRPSERMRFLRYGDGMFFREHCDASYYAPNTGEKSFYTLHLFLNDSAEGLATDSKFSAPPEEAPKEPEKTGAAGPELRGGAMTFYTDDIEHHIDVFPRAGRVLIFQQRDMLHSAGYVHAGARYAMRGDLMFERTRDETD